MNVTLDKHAPTKKRYARANRAPYINKKLSKEMKRSRLRNKFLNAASDLDRKASNKQRNYVVSLLRKEKKKQFYSNLSTNISTENRISRKLLNPF